MAIYINGISRTESAVGTIVASIITFLFFYQPGVDRAQLLDWIRSFFPSEFYFVVLFSFFLGNAVFIASNLVFYLIYHLEHPWLERFKIERRPWPWNRGEKARKEHVKLVWKTLGLIAFNQFCVTLPLLWTNYDTQKKIGISFSSSDIPDWKVSAFHVTLFMVIEDTMFYWGHRFLHWKKIYRYIHKIHHTHYSSIGIAAEYAHPVEFVLANIIPFAAGPMLLRSHIYTVWMWTMLRVGETVDGHCGYEFVWSPYRLLPFSGSATAHDFHHSHVVGNYASFFDWWDRICGTDKAFVEFQAKEKRRFEQEASDSSSPKTPSSKSSHRMTTRSAAKKRSD